MKIAAARGTRLVYQFSHRVDAHDLDAMCAEFAREPTFTATHIKHRCRFATQDSVDDRPIGHPPTAFDLLRAHGVRPRSGVINPGLKNPGISE